MPTVSAETDLPNQDQDCTQYRDHAHTQLHGAAGLNAESHRVEAVTFLFSDIEGSTRLWETHPDAMQAALARHDAHLRQSIEARDGHVFKTAGDSFCAAFARPDAALDAALTAQTALHAEPWGLPDGGTLRVRLALHMGPAEQRGGDYFGTSLSRTARLLAAAHGGQTLVSGTLAAFLEERLPDGLSLRSLGRHRLKDLSQPQEIFQMAAPGLANDFPPLRSLESFAHNLPGQLTSFIGRESEMADAHAALQKSRLVTLCGPGGSGKTRLALQVAAEALDDYADGVWLVELAPVSDPKLVPQTVAAVLGIREESERRLRQTLLDTLRPKSLLLILDNCEHLIDASAHLAESLLQACPALTILATSREALEIGGEMTLPLSSLSMPPLNTPGLPLPAFEKLLECEAIRLFIDRATSALPTFRFSAGNSAAVASVCARLDGIPLALELAAARVKVLSPEQIADRLDDRFRLLSGGSRTALPRQQTLRALLDWSYDLLAPSEQTLLRRLSIFAGGWSLDAAESVCAGDTLDDWEVLDLLSRLVAKSLVVVEPPLDGQVRYHLQENLRQYAAEKLAETDDSAALAEQHRAWFLAYAEAAEPELTGSEQARWLNRLARDYDNLRLALSNCQANRHAEDSLRLAGSLYHFWLARSHFTEGLQWLESALALADEGNIAPAVLAKALTGAGVLSWSRGDYDKAKAFHQRSLSLHQEIGDRQGIARALNNLGLIACHKEDFATARSFFEESIATYREIGYLRDTGVVLHNLGGIALDMDDFETAKKHLEESLSIFRTFQDVRGITYSLREIGHIALMQKQYSEAHALLRECLALQKEREDKAGGADTLLTLGFVAAALMLYSRSVPLISAAEALQRSVGIVPQTYEHPLYDNSLMAARQALGATEFEALWIKGSSWSFSDAIFYAMEENTAPVNTECEPKLNERVSYRRSHNA